MEKSRYEVNRNIRAVLVRNNVNLERVEFSFVGKTAYIRGELSKINGNEFSVSAIETIATEISKIPFVRDIQFELLNWSIMLAGGSWHIMKAKKSAHSQQAGEEAGRTIHLEKDKPR